MYAVVRETNYAQDKPIYQTPEFREFQREHANLDGYIGNLVVDAGGGTFLTLTLWETQKHMVSAREAIGPVVQRTILPLLTSPAKLLGTGPIVSNDLVRTWRELP